MTTAAPNLCACGCYTPIPVGRTWWPGHDGRAVGRAVAAARQGDHSLIDALPTAALQMQAESHLEN